MESKVTLNYVPGLDGLRAIAVMLVLISHRFPKDHFLNFFPIGDFGVDIFFVLSGYLISRILFYHLTNAKTYDLKIKVYKNFLVRRLLRILPIYYIVLIGMYLTSGLIESDFKNNFWWYFTYTANYLNFLEGKWFGTLSHLWSLSVEEQFYLIWPILLIFVIKKRIYLLFISLIVLGTIYPFIIGSGITKVLTISCVNAFAIGGLLAYLEINIGEKLKDFNHVFTSLILISLSGIIIHFSFYGFTYFSQRLLISLITMGIIFICRYYDNKFIVRCMEIKVLKFIGIISYGIYLLHNIVPEYWRFSFSYLGLDTPSIHYKFSYIEFIFQTLFIILLSYISWIIIEKPIMKLKKNYSY